VSRCDTIPLALEGRQAGAAVCNCVEEHTGNETRKIELDEDAIAALIGFFRLLDQWDREARKQ
jgi:hypothetical protein